MQNHDADRANEPVKKLSAKLLKGLIALALVLALMFWVAQSGVMRSYERPVHDTQQGDHQSDQGLRGTQDDRGLTNPAR